MAWTKRQPKKPYKKTDDIITKLANIHGIKDIDEFLNPSHESIHDPHLLKNIGEVRDIILDALAQKKRMGIFLDVDTDGMCSGAIMYNYLKNFTDNLVVFYNQRSQGHGLVEALPNNNVPEDIDLLIAVDSSSNDVDACKEISEKGIEIVIIDHHIIEQENPYATIVNCQQDDYPNKSLSGSGHVWKVTQVLDEFLKTDYSKNLIDLAGVGIQGDAMDMSDKENRAIVSFALDQIERKEDANAGLVAILKAKKQKFENLSSTTISFTIAPMLNGASRLDRIDLAVQCLTEPDGRKCLKIAKEIATLNDERKTLQVELANMLEPQVNDKDKIIFVIDNDKKVGKNFSGLIAGELAQRHNRPCAVLAPSGRSGKAWSGSFRSVQGFQLHSFFNSLPEEYFIFNKGHEGAGGIGIKSWLFDGLRDSINEALKDFEFESDIIYDLEMNVEDLSQKLIYKIQQFTRINGQNMPEAKFKITNLFSIEKTLMGSKKDTVKVECDNLDLMKFRTTQEFYEEVPEFKDLEAVGTLNLNKFYNGKLRKFVISNQLFLDEYRVV